MSVPQGWDQIQNSDWMQLLRDKTFERFRVLGSNSTGTYVIGYKKDGSQQAIVITDLNFSRLKYATGTGTVTVTGSTQAASVNITIPNSPFSDSAYSILISAIDPPLVSSDVFTWNAVAVTSSSFNVFITTAQAEVGSYNIRFFWLVLE
jgi:hypothetical protein